MPGGAKYLRWGTALDDFAGVQNGDAIAERSDRQQIVGNVKDAHAEFAVELRKQAQDFGLRDGVQGAGGFIGDEQGRAVKDGHGDDDALGLTDAEMARAAAKEVGVIGETHARKRVADGCGAFCLRSGGVRTPGFGELRPDVKSGIERGQRALQNDADFAAAKRAHLRFGLCKEVFALEAQIAAGDSAFQMKEGKNRRRQDDFSAAHLPEGSENWSCRDYERTSSCEFRYFAL